jgi:alcohol dehydrogenase class IV
MNFEFAAPTRIVFGSGASSKVGALTAAWGRRVFVVTGRTAQRAETLLKSLAEEPPVSEQDATGNGQARAEGRAKGGTGRPVEVFRLSGEPTLAAVRSAVDAARTFGAEMVIGFGGGSAIDLAKAVAGLLTNPGDPMRYLEVVGEGLPLSEPALPWMAIPTTAGTGAEATRNAVIGVPERGVKASLRSPGLLARIALVDPELTLGLPPAVTAMTGMDALTQLLEAYVCSRANPLTDALSAAGLPRAARALSKAVDNPGDIEARSDLSLASLGSGLALSNAGLGAVHGFAAPIGGLFPAPHGAVCAILLAPVMEANLRAARARKGAADTVARYGDVARWLTGRPDARAEDGAAWVRAEVARFKIPRLAAYGVTSNDISEIVLRAKAASSMRANPVALEDRELAEIVSSVL